MKTVLRHLAIAHHFDGTININDMEFHPKPSEPAFVHALKRTGAPSYAHLVLLDDRIDNLTTAKRLGMGTVWVGTTDSHPDADFSIMSPIELRNIMPELFIE